MTMTYDMRPVIKGTGWYWWRTVYYHYKNRKVPYSIAENSCDLNKKLMKGVESAYYSWT